MAMVVKWAVHVAVYVGLARVSLWQHQWEVCACACVRDLSDEPARLGHQCQRGNKRPSFVVEPLWDVLSVVHSHIRNPAQGGEDLDGHTHTHTHHVNSHLHVFYYLLETSLQKVPIALNDIKRADIVQLRLELIYCMTSNTSVWPAWPVTRHYQVTSIIHSGHTPSDLM